MSPTLRKLLSDEYPEWEEEYEEDLVEAVLDLGLLDATDVEAALTVLNFEDEMANWERLETYYRDYNADTQD